MALSHSPSIVTNGLVLALDAANPKSYPGTGSTWTDLSGLGNSATLTSITYDANNNGSLLFNADADTAVIPHSSSLNFNSVFTVTAWIKVNSFNTSLIYNVLSKKSQYNNTQPGWSCQYDYRTTGVLQYRNNNGSVLNDSTPTANVNNTAILNQTTTWVNSVWVISSTNVTFYLNGIASGISTATYTATDTSNSIYIGKTVGSVGDGSLLMNLSNVSIYNRALSAAEVAQNFNALRGRYGL